MAKFDSNSQCFPCNLKLSISTTPVKCNGGTTNATASVNGGTSPYTYSWSNGQTTSNTTGISSGTYTCTVTDSSNCKATAFVNITQPAAIKDSITNITPAACGKNIGSATVKASGGMPAYSYSWSPSGGTNATASNLSAGTYTCTVTDNNGCRQTAIVNISNAGGPTSTHTQTNLKCNGGTNGIATASASGGTQPYTYTWSNGETSATASGLSAGTYTCTIKDSNGCIAYEIVTITQPAAISAGASTNPATCGANNGSASVTTSGGTLGYTYNWSPSGGANATATGLSAGTYTCIVTDANGCTLTTVANVISVGSINITVRPDTTINAGDSIALYVAGGETYLWSPSSGLSCDTCSSTLASPGATTNYCVLVDSNGCKANACVTITVESNCSDFKVPNVFTPNDDGINDDFVVNVLNDSEYSIIIYDRWGKTVYASSNPAQYWNGRLNATDYLAPDGVYYYIINATCGKNNYIKKGFVQIIGEKK